MLYYVKAINLVLRRLPKLLFIVIGYPSARLPPHIRTGYERFYWDTSVAQAGEVGRPRGMDCLQGEDPDFR